MKVTRTRVQTAVVLCCTLAMATGICAQGSSDPLPKTTTELLPQAAPQPSAPVDQAPSSGAGSPPVAVDGPQPPPTPAPPAPKIDYSKYLQNDVVGYATIAVEKAAIQKSLGDEHYLRDDRENAEKSYRATLDTLSQEAPDDKLTDTQRSVKKLLRVDVEYRLLNLRLGKDFWSGYRTSRPSTPHRHLLVLEGLLADLETQTKEINNFLGKADLDASEMARIQGMRIDYEGKIKNQTLAQEKAVIEGRKQSAQLSTWDERVRNLTSQRLTVEAKAKQLADEQKQLSATASSLLVKAIAAGTGIPPSATTAVMTGNVKAALLQEAAAQLGDPNSSISKAVGEVSGTAQQLQDLYITASKNYETLKQTGDTLKQAADVIRKPTFDGLVTAGGALWQKLPDAERKRLTSNVMNSAPAAGILESYRRVDLAVQDATTLRRRIETQALQRLPMPAVRADLLMLANQVAKNEGQLQLQLRSVFKGISRIDLTDEQFRKYTEHFLHAGAADLFAKVAANQRQALAQAMGEPTIASAIEKLASSGISALPQGRISNDQIVFVLAGKRIEIKIKVLFEGAELAGARSGLKDLPVIYADMTKTQDLYRLALAQLPTDMLSAAVEAALRKIPDASERRSVMDEIAQGISSEATQRAKQTLVQQTLGSAVVEDLVKRPEARPRLAVPLSYPASSQSNDGLSPEADAAAKAALNYAIPGAGLALSMAQTFAKMDANSSEMNRLAEQSLKIMAEQEQLYDLATEAYFEHAIAEVEQQRAEVLRDSADRQLGVFSAELGRRANAAQRNLTAVGVRRALTYYAAERLREEFDLFDRSYAMWNSGVASRGAISAEIQSDPTNTRYALDSDIHLFDWLNRERESTRGDPDTLLVHWRQMLRLARDVCTKRGCKPGDGNLGQIAATGNISIKGILATSTEWRRFQDWQRNPSGRFVMQFSILPGSRIIPLQYENIRIVDLRLAGRTGGTDAILPQVALRHSGIAQIPRADKGRPGGLVFQREALLPRQAAFFNLPTDFNVNELSNRYNGAFTEVNYPVLRAFEGYGLYAMYELTLENTAENRRIDDLFIKFAYFYSDASNVVSEEQYLNSLRATEAQLPFEIYDYQIVAKGSSACADQGVGAGSTAPTKVSAVPASMRPSFFAAFNRRTDPPAADALDMLAEADRTKLASLQACLETRVELVCKPMSEIKRIAASWVAARDAAPGAERGESFDVHVLADDSKVPQLYRDRYAVLCGRNQ